VNGVDALSNSTVIDTDILIDAGRGIESAVTFLERRESMLILSVSVITAMELLVGCRDKKEQRITERFLERLALLKIDEAISDKATQLLRQYRLSHGLADRRCINCRNSDGLALSACFEESTGLSVCRGACAVALPIS